MLKAMLIAATALGAGTTAGAVAPALADEVIIHRDDAPPPPTTSTTTVEKHEAPVTDCSSSTVHKENDAGDSKTVTRSNCN